jgi:hypothetical protein
VKTISEFLMNCLRSLNTRDKTVSIYAHNVICNSGGGFQKRSYNFHKSEGHDLIGVGHSHILFIIQFKQQCICFLLIDLKIYSYFYVHSQS